MRSSFQFQGDPLIEDIRVTASRALFASTENEAPPMAEIPPEANSFNVAGSKGRLAGWKVSGVDHHATDKHVRNRVTGVRIVRTHSFVPPNYTAERN